MECWRYHRCNTLLAKIKLTVNPNKSLPFTICGARMTFKVHWLPCLLGVALNVYAFALFLWHTNPIPNTFTKSPMDVSNWYLNSHNPRIRYWTSACSDSGLIESQQWHIMLPFARPKRIHGFPQFPPQSEMVQPTHWQSGTGLTQLFVEAL